MVTGLQLALHSASAETRYELVFAKSLARAPDALNPSLNLILLDLDLPDVDPHDPLVPHPAARGDVYVFRHAPSARCSALMTELMGSLESPGYEPVKNRT
jgi:hypothetical protein